MPALDGIKNLGIVELLSLGLNRPLERTVEIEITKAFNLAPDGTQILSFPTTDRKGPGADRCQANRDAVGSLIPQFSASHARHLLDHDRSMSNHSNMSAHWLNRRLCTPSWACFLHYLSGSKHEVEFDRDKFPRSVLVEEDHWNMGKFRYSH